MSLILKKKMVRLLFTDLCRGYPLVHGYPPLHVKEWFMCFCGMIYNTCFWRLQREGYGKQEMSKF